MILLYLIILPIIVGALIGACTIKLLTADYSWWLTSSPNPYFRNGFFFSRKDAFTFDLYQQLIKMVGNMTVEIPVSVFLEGNDHQ